MEFTVLGDTVRRNWDGHGKLRQRRVLGLVCTEGDKYLREHICWVVLPVHLIRAFKKGESVRLSPTKKYRLPNGVVRLTTEELSVGVERFVLTNSDADAMPPSGGVASAHELGVGGAAHQHNTTGVGGIDILRREMSDFIDKVGESHIGVFGTEKPGSAALSLAEFMEDFERLRLMFLTREFSRAFWVMERQPGTQDWHVHLLGDMGRDVQTEFPFKEYFAHDYRLVPVKFRNAWKRLSGAEALGFGRTNLLPVRTESGSVVSYLTGGPYGRNPGLKPPPLSYGHWEIGLTKEIEGVI